MKNNIEKIRNKQCYGCQACSNVCPKKCIKMEEDWKGFVIPKVNCEECTDCGLCLQVCPAKKGGDKAKRKLNTKVYAVNVRDKEVRTESTSGGAFYSIAEYVIQKGGCVYGAAFNDKHEVIHICAENLEDVKRCMKSKYVQSNLSTVYQQIAVKSKGQLVLFSGTPCQVAALHNYPNVNKNNLILMDVICHGIPSPGLWRKYLEEREQENGKIAVVKTRDKTRFGSLESETVIQFEDGTEYRRVLDKDAYMKAFMKGYSLRDRCYDCQYKGRRRKSDFTVGDFRSADKYMKDADTVKGMTMLIVNTKKGTKLLEKIIEKYDSKRIYNKEVLLRDWTWGLSFPYSRKTELFYQKCFQEKLPVAKSISKANWLMKDMENKVYLEKLREIVLESKNKLWKIYFKYFFKL